MVIKIKFHIFLFLISGKMKYICIVHLVFIFYLAPAQDIPPRQVNDTAFSYIENGLTIKVSLTSRDSVSLLKITGYENDKRIFSDKMQFASIIYRFYLVDINNDDVKDFALGLYKQNKRETAKTRKIHFYSLRRNKIYPLWRGSKVSNELFDFMPLTLCGRNYIKLIEKRGKNCNIVLYKWYGFGLRFDKNIYEKLDFKDAIKLFQEQPK
jgi:hypothetical protein